MCKSCGCSETPEEKKTYECEECGKTSEEQEECCGKPMKEKE